MPRREELVSAHIAIKQAKASLLEALSDIQARTMREVLESKDTTDGRLITLFLALNSIEEELSRLKEKGGA